MMIYKDYIDNFLLYRKARSYYRKYGLMKSILRSIYVIFFDFQKVYFLKNILANYGGELPINSQFKFEIINYESAKKYSEIEEQIKDELDVFEIKKYHLCCVAILNKIPISWVWIGKGYIFNHALRKKELLPENEYYIYNAFTKPRYRNLGVFTSVLKFMNYSILEEGGKIVNAAISTSNSASIRAFERAGFQKYDEITFIKIFLKFRIVRSRQHKYVESDSDYTTNGKTI